MAKFRIKLAGRLALLRLSEKSEEVPEEVEVLLQEMLEALQDKVGLRPPSLRARRSLEARRGLTLFASSQDTIVRWSAAKYIARISECIPEDMGHQISEVVLDMFETSFEEVDMAEHGLQGACFAFGELARRGRVQEDLVDRLVACALRVSCSPCASARREADDPRAAPRPSSSTANEAFSPSAPAFAIQHPTSSGPSLALYDQRKSPPRSRCNSPLDSSPSPCLIVRFIFGGRRVRLFRRVWDGG